MALYVIRARESGHYLTRTSRGPERFQPELDTRARTFDDPYAASLYGEHIPFACDVLELRPVYRDEAAK